jgi:malate dehydrogenase (oxaloacetate-decarboxylating)(NADP+)
LAHKAGLVGAEELARVRLFEERFEAALGILKKRFVSSSRSLFDALRRPEVTWQSLLQEHPCHELVGLDPRVAFLSFSNFGYPISERAIKMAEAPEVLDARGVDFEYEGEMTVDVALNMDAAARYPFSRLTGPANVLVVPARHSASISVKLMQEMAGATVIGPILTGVPKPIQICSTNSTVNDILNMAAIAAGGLGQTR